MQSRGQVVLAALVIGLLIGAAATYAIEGFGLDRTTTSLPPVTITTTRTVTTSGRGLIVGSVASNALDLSTSINATEISVGQNLNISISLFNISRNSSTLPQWSDGSLGGNWTFQGVPVVTWPECSLAPNQIRYGFQFPIEVLVLSGNYTALQLSSLANLNLVARPCGDGEVVIPIYTFEPESNLVNITYIADGGVGLQPVGVFPATSDFILNGYWNLTTLQEQANGSYISEPALCQLCKVPSSIPFVPGTYTLGVADAWGQYEVLHFQVVGSG